jgi:hypothetical protein
MPNSSCNSRIVICRRAASWFAFRYFFFRRRVTFTLPINIYKESKPITCSNKAHIYALELRLWLHCTDEAVWCGDSLFFRHRRPIYTQSRSLLVPVTQAFINCYTGVFVRASRLQFVIPLHGTPDPFSAWLLRLIKGSIVVLPLLKVSLMILMLDAL